MDNTPNLLARHGAMRGLAVLLVVTALLVPLTAQRAKSGQPLPRESKRSDSPRTGDGRPNLQGVWSFATATPLERPPELAGKETLTDEEAAAFEAHAAASQVDRPPAAGDPGTYNQFWYDRGKTVVRTRRTSLIVDPPDGRLPPLTPEAERRLADLKEARRGAGDDEPRPGHFVEDIYPHGPSVRCIVGFNSGPPMLAAAYNNHVQIFQTREHVAVLNEMIHNTRIVPLDGRPHVSPAIRQWVGDSRGHWDDDTLVIETTNFTSIVSDFRNGGRPLGWDTKMRLIERFTRVDADTLMYEFTVDDPGTFVRPWTAQVPMTRSDDEIYEYACHEGNYSLATILAGVAAKTSESK